MDREDSRSGLTAIICGAGEDEGRMECNVLHRSDVLW